MNVTCLWLWLMWVGRESLGKDLEKGKNVIKIYCMKKIFLKIEFSLELTKMFKDTLSLL